MPKRKKPNPAATSGWEGEARQEKIDSAVASHLLADGQRIYQNAYDRAKHMKAEGKHADEIRAELRRTAQKQKYSGDDSPQRADEKKILNIVEDDFTEVARQGVEDALADRPAKYKLPPGY